MEIIIHHSHCYGRKKIAFYVILMHSIKKNRVIPVEKHSFKPEKSGIILA